MVQTINVSGTPGMFMPSIHYSQGDIGRQFIINVGDFEIPSGATVECVATKPSGFGFTVEGTVSDNTVTFTTTDVMTDEAGRFPAELRITSGGNVIGTANFYMWGELDPHPEGTIDGSEGSIVPELTLLVERVEAAASSVLDMEVEAQTLPAGSAATYTYNEEENKAIFGIPEGQAGSGAVGTVASAYSATKTYAVGDYVIQNGNLYRCTTAITTAESFTAAHWAQVVLADDVTDLKSDLSDETSARILLAGRVTTAESDIDTLETHKVAQPLDGNNQPTNGTSGQSLRTKGDGTTEWADEGIPTDAQTAQAVSDWLDAHPEATTTVSDGSLTYKKLVTGTLGFITPEMFGAVGDGVTDDTDAINAALSSGHKTIVFTGNYAITTSDNDEEYGHEGLGLVVSSNTTLLFFNSKLIGIPNNSKRYSVIKVKDVENVNIIGAEIQCDKALNAGEHGFGIQVRHGDHIRIDNCKIYNALGDCITVGGHQDSALPNDGPSTNITISNCELYGARRQGITIGLGQNILVDSCYIHDIGGTAPQSGIDIEPNHAQSVCDDIVIRNTRIVNTAGSSLNISNCINNTGFIIEGCYFDNMVYCAAGFLLVSGSVLTHINFNNNSSPLHVISNCRLLGYVNFEQSALFKDCYIYIPQVTDALNILYTGEYAQNAEAIFINCKMLNPYGCNFNRGKLFLKNCDIELNVEKRLFVKGKLDIEGCRINIQNSVNNQIIDCSQLDMIGCYITHNRPTLLWTNDSSYVGKVMKNIIIASVNNTLSLRAYHVIDNIVTSGTTIQTTGTNQGNITY